MYIIVLAVLGLFIFAVYASASIGSQVYIEALCRIKTVQPMVALTFDDGPDPVQTPKVLDVLRDENIKALFFCIGSRAEKYPHIVERIISEGHIIGNHSYSHSNRFPFFGNTQMKVDVEECTSVLENIINEKIVLFRPPFGVTNPTVRRVVKQGRFNVIGWSIRSLDTLKYSHKKVIRHITNRLHNGAIILLHDDRDQSEVLLENVIKEIKNNGFEIVRLDKII